MKRSLTPALLAVALFLGTWSWSQDAYREPPAPIPAILDAEPLPAVQVSPDRSWLLLMGRRALPPIVEVAAPELRLAGDRINARSNGPSRDLTFKSLALINIATRTERPLETPKNARISFPLWSPDAAHIAFTVTEDNGIALFLAEVATGKVRRLTPARLNAAAAGTPCLWAARELLVCRMIPEGRGPAPAPGAVPTGPVIQETTGRVAPNPTYQDLLQSPGDEVLFEHYYLSQLALVTLDGGVTPLGTPGLHTTTEPSPDGRYVVVETVHRPFSYLVPMERFPRRLEIWDRQGKLVRRLADTPLQEEVPIARDAVPTGPRRAGWRSDAAATLSWVEALDGGDPARPAPKRDRLLALAAPFGGDPTALFEGEYRVSQVVWGHDDLALVRESWWKTRKTRSFLIDPAKPGAPRLLFDRSSEDRYSDPGRLVTVANAWGAPVLLTSKDGRAAYLIGDGASPEGDRPFADKLDLATGKAARIFRSAAPYFEQPVAVLDANGRQLVTRQESVSEPPNYLLRDLTRKTAFRLTAFPDPAPQFAGVTKELIHYRRADGVELSATLYLPAGYDKSQGRLPFLFWAYPLEFKTASAAAQVAGSPYRFTRPTGISHLFVLTQGYAVLDNPTMPIVGEGDQEPNDTYVDQLVASAQAAVNKLVEMGVADRGRIAIGGHSYGAFMTANLLAHSDLFRTGIARSGAYNRTLTPFGFQSEERSFWKARDTYIAMSPFTWADKIKEPILLIHGAADNNTGTFPIQSERMYAALKGNGAKTRLVLLPAEAHGYRARESTGHTLWEMVSWLDTYLKSAPAGQ